MAKAFTKKNFQQEVLESKIPVMVDFWASWCGPCRMLGPVIDAMAETAEQNGYKIGKVNVDEEEELAARYNIMTIPTVMVFQNGRPVKQVSGVRPRAELEAMVLG